MQLSTILELRFYICLIKSYLNIYSTRKGKKPLSCKLKLTEIKLFLFISKERNAVGHNTNGGDFNGRKQGEI